MKRDMFFVNKKVSQVLLSFGIILSLHFWAAARELTQQSDSASISRLKNELADAINNSNASDIKKEVYQSIDELVEQKADIVSFLVGQLMGKEVQHDSVIFDALSYVGTEQAKAALLEIALDTKYTNSYLLGDNAAKAYMRLANDSTEVSQLLKSKQPRVIDAALEGLRTTTLTRPAVESLGQLLNSTSSWRHHVISSAFGWDTSSDYAARKIELLLSNLVNLENLEDKDKVDPERGTNGYEFAYGSYISAMELMTGANNILLERMDSANEQQRKLIIIALGRRREPAIRDKLLQMIKTEKDGFLRWQAVTAFYYIAKEQDLPFFKELAANDPYIRRSSEHAIAHGRTGESPNYYPIREQAKTLLEWFPIRPPQNDEEMADYERLAKMEKLDLSKSRITDAGLVHLEKLTNLKELNLNDTSVADAGMVHIKALENLEKLYLDNTKITDEGLANLKDMVKLKSLGLSNTRITDEGLANISGLTNITFLGLGGTRISDAGIVYLKKMTNLNNLQLGDSFVTDKGLSELRGLAKLNSLNLLGKDVDDKWLEQLEEFKNLNWLGLGDTRVTNTGLRELKKVMPELMISRY